MATVRVAIGPPVNAALLRVGAELHPCSPAMSWRWSVWSSGPGGGGFGISWDAEYADWRSDE